MATSGSAAPGNLQCIEREYQRARDLVARGFFSRQKLDEARRLRDTARSVLESARLQAHANEDSGVEQALAVARVARPRQRWKLPGAPRAAADR